MPVTKTTRTAPTGFLDSGWHDGHRNGGFLSMQTTPSGFPITPRNGLTSLLGQPRQRPDTSGQSLSELLGRALAEVDGIEYQPPRVAELEALLAPENFKLLMANPAIAQAVNLWANAGDADRASLVKSLATLIAHEAGKPELEWQIRQEVSKIK